MKIVFLSSNIEIVDEWKTRYAIKEAILYYDEEEINKYISVTDEYILIADFDSIAPIINKMISSNTLPKNTIVLEKVPEIVTGKALISHGIKAYANSRMLPMHFNQMLDTVSNSKIWTYPELTAALTNSIKKDILSDESLHLINNRLSEKEKEVVFLILGGLTNNAISNKLDITLRTVKAHISSIFSKLHINDRLALVLLLK